MTPVHPLATARLRPLTSIDETFERIAALAEAIQGEETLPLAASLGRVTALDLPTETALPRFDHAAMDGFGLCAIDLARPVPFDLVVSGRVFAGGTATTEASPGRAIRLLTGAPIPTGVEAVVPEETCIVSGNTVRIQKLPRGANIRRQGEDALRGAVVVGQGTRIDARHLAILAASGFSALRARRRVRVGLLSIGDELRVAPERLGPGQIHDVNGPMLKALLQEPAVEIVDLGLQRDDRPRLAGLLREAAGEVDVLVSSGGVSGSDADHVAAAIADAGGTAATYALALKPGKPLLAGRIGATPMIGLPGNPVATLVNFMLFVRPLVRLRAGATASRPRGHQALAAQPIAHRAGRTEFAPARIASWMKDGQAEVGVVRPSGAARLHPLVSADGLVEIGLERGDIAAGEVVGFHAFHAAFST